MPTAYVYIADALYDLNVYQRGAPISANDGQIGFRHLNYMMSSWALSMSPPVVARDVFPIVSNQQSYSWGPGGDFTTLRPPKQSSITGASLILNTTLPLAQQTEVPLAVYTDDGYRNARIKYQPNTQATGIYYQATSPLGTLIVWPVPNTTINGLAIYREQQFGPFADLLQTSYVFPDGYDEAIHYNLEKRLCPVFSRTMSDDATMLAAESLRNIEAANMKLTDVANDLVSNTASGWYNINTGMP